MEILYEIFLLFQIQHVNVKDHSVELTVSHFSLYTTEGKPIPGTESQKGMACLVFVPDVHHPTVECVDVAVYCINDYRISTVAKQASYVSEQVFKIFMTTQYNENSKFTSHNLGP